MDTIFRFVPACEIIRAHRSGAYNTASLLKSALDGLTYRVTQLNESVEAIDFINLMNDAKSAGCNSPYSSANNSTVEDAVAGDNHRSEFPATDCAPRNLSGDVFPRQLGNTSSANDRGSSADYSRAVRVPPGFEERDSTRSNFFPLAYGWSGCSQENSLIESQVLKDVEAAILPMGSDALPIIPDGFLSKAFAKPSPLEYGGASVNMETSGDVLMEDLPCTSRSELGDFSREANPDIFPPESGHNLTVGSQLLNDVEDSPFPVMVETTGDVLPSSLEPDAIYGADNEAQMRKCSSEEPLIFFTQMSESVNKVSAGADAKIVNGMASRSEDRVDPNVNLFDFDVPVLETQPLIPLPSTRVDEPNLLEQSFDDDNLVDPLLKISNEEQVGGGVDNSYFTIVSEKSSYLKNFRLRGREIVIALQSTPENRDPLEWLQAALDTLLIKLKRDVEPDSKAGMSIVSSDNPERPIHVSYRRLDQISSEVLLQRIEKVIQSNERFLLDGRLSISFTYVDQPNGGRGRRNLLSSFHDYCKKQRSIVVIANDDNLCLARALCVGVSRHEDSEKVFKAMKRGGRMQTSKAVALCEESKVSLANGGGLDHVSAFQDYLQSYQITVFGDRKGREVLFEGPLTPAADGSRRKSIDLIYGENHFNYIVSLPGAFKCGYYCRPCRLSYNTIHGHKCDSECSRCMASPPCEICEPSLCCDVCQRNFYGRDCFLKHLEKRGKARSTCDVLKFCKLCGRVYSMISSKSGHVCGEIYCHICKVRHDSRKLCYIRPVPKIKSPSTNFIYVFYDIECRQDTPVQGTTGRFSHTPNLLVSQNSCANCIDKISLEECSTCGNRQSIFSSTEPVYDFLKSLVKLRENGFTEIICVAHYAKGYDSHFIIKSMIENMKWQPKVILNGAKLMCIEYESLKFIDSINFIPIPLSKLPSAMGLDVTVVKGYFPHLFNAECNWNYVGPMPAASDYGVQQMSSEEAAKFHGWYNKMVEKNYVFHMQEEIKKYCVQDVNILRLSCCKFRREFLSLNETDPFREALTIASACMRVFKKKFLKDGEIAIVPQGGYRWGDVQSRKAIGWLVSEERKLGVEIRHAGNGREMKILGKRVDGYVKTDTEERIYEFHGCFFHGCVKCYKNRHEPVSNSSMETMQTRYENTEKKMKFFKDRGYKVIQKWECEFEREKQRDKELEKFVLDHPMCNTTVLNPRDAFYGGRTNAVKLYKKANVDEREEIRYIDICSLYPFVNKYREYPIGHPTIFVGDDCPSLDQLEGIVNCQVLPPHDLYHPVLPVKANAKLLFPLCRTCAEQENQDCCFHNDSERLLTGTWVTAELKKAVSVGYKVTRMFEAWHYETTVYSRETGEGGLFSGYINMFLKIKQEASGWPSWCASESDKERYLKDFLEREGVGLQMDCVEHNPGKRSLAKLMLNSFWGKFGQRENLTRTSVVRKVDQLYSLFTNPNVEVLRLVEINEDVLYAHWADVDEAISPSSTSSIVLACYTTAHARLELYSYLEKLNRRVLYFDTDSILYTQRPGEWVPPVGDYLGDMTDEIAPMGKSCYISEFVSGGPKNYAYVVRSHSDSTFEKSCCKVRGVTINSSNDKVVCFDTLKAMVLDGAPGQTIVYPHRITRTKNHDVISRTETKLFRVVYTKRKRIENFDTLPYGFKRQRNE